MNEIVGAFVIAAFYGGMGGYFVIKGMHHIIALEATHGSTVVGVSLILLATVITGSIVATFSVLKGEA